ncbi:hypothetical protein CTI12_AA452990 [Artemisia annua]|uniref:Uncharacterized protein n=1 Tax=Artemisia annua TaxID=35608 RepID=A0A2U1LU15_ARTAN|nr:hypothetical protein CTI12_AA452990 [Artemisia annua]
MYAPYMLWMFSNKVQRTGREIVLTAFLQCKLCASKIREWLTGFQGVEGAEPDINYSQVAIKGSCCDTHELVEAENQNPRLE